MSIKKHFAGMAVLVLSGLLAGQVHAASPASNIALTGNGTIFSQFGNASFTLPSSSQAFINGANTSVQWNVNNPQDLNISSMSSCSDANTNCTSKITIQFDLVEDTPYHLVSTDLQRSGSRTGVASLDLDSFNYTLLTNTSQATSDLNMTGVLSAGHHTFDITTNANSSLGGLVTFSTELDLLPEPSSLVLLCAGGTALLARRRRG